MASTRNRNTPGDYKMEKRAYQQKCDYNTYTSYGMAESTYYPGLGLSGGAKLPRDQLSANYCDTESNLFGIGSSNLETPQPKVTPQNKTLQTLNISDPVPMFMPKPLEVDTSIQRPLYLN